MLERQNITLPSLNTSNLELVPLIIAMATLTPDCYHGNSWTPMLQIRGIGSSWSICSEPTHLELMDKEPGYRRSSDPNQDPLGDLHVQGSSARRQPVRYASRSASMVESTLDPPIVSTKFEQVVEKSGFCVVCF